MGDQNYPGIIDEVRIYNRTLTASEISRLAVPTVTGWVWMDEGIGYDGELGYSFHEDDLVFFFSPGYVWHYYFNTEQWSYLGPTGLCYFDHWPFVYSLEADDIVFVYPPADGWHVYHNSTGQWSVLPQIIP